MTTLVTEGLSESVIQILESQGLPIKRSLDIDVPAFPKDITLVDDQELKKKYPKGIPVFEVVLEENGKLSFFVKDVVKKS